MRRIPAAFLTLLCAVRLSAETLPSAVEVTIEPQKFGDVSSILKVDSTVASFKFDQPVNHLALVLEAYPKEPRAVHVARLALELTKPVAEGRFCVQMADQGFLPIGNGAPHQMQLFMQLDCGGTIISSSQSFLKEKFNFSKSLARCGPGTLSRKVSGHRAPVFWLMGNSDSGAYFNDDDLDKMIAKNKDAYVLLAYLEVAKPPPPIESPVLAKAPAAPTPAKAESSPSSKPQVMAVVAAFIGPPFPVPLLKEEVKKPEVAGASSKTGAKPTSTAKGKSSKSSSSSKKKKKSS